MSLKMLEPILGYVFKTPQLFEQALTHRSIIGVQNNNERLEFLGDAIVNFVLADLLYQKFPNATEGMLTRLRAQMVKGETLAQLAQSMAIGDYLKMSISDIKSGTQMRHSVLADTLEAIIGAIFLDGGLGVCRACIQQWYQDRLDNLSLKDGTKKDPKTRLQEFLQAREQALPNYALIKTEGAPHDPDFFVQCEVLGDIKTFGQAKSRRRAEQLAAEEALSQLQTKRK